MADFPVFPGDLPPEEEKSEQLFVTPAPPQNDPPKEDSAEPEEASRDEGTRGEKGDEEEAAEGGSGAPGSGAPEETGKESESGDEEDGEGRIEVESEPNSGPTPAPTNKEDEFKTANVDAVPMEISSLPAIPPIPPSVPEDEELPPPPPPDVVQDRETPASVVPSLPAQATTEESGPQGGGREADEVKNCAELKDDDGSMRELLSALWPQVESGVEKVVKKEEKRKKEGRVLVPHTESLLISPMRIVFSSLRLNDEQKCRRIQDLISLTSATPTLQDYIHRILSVIQTFPFQQRMAFFALRQMLLCHPVVLSEILTPALVPRLFTTPEFDSYGADFLLLFLTYKAEYCRKGGGSEEDHSGKRETQAILELCCKREFKRKMREKGRGGGSSELIKRLSSSPLRDWLCRIWMDVPSSRPQHPSTIELCLYWLINEKDSLEVKRPVFLLLDSEICALGNPGKGELWLLAGFFEMIERSGGACHQDLQHTLLLVKRERLAEVISKLFLRARWSPGRVLGLWAAICCFVQNPVTPPSYLTGIDHDYGETPLPLFDLMASFILSFLRFKPATRHTEPNSRSPSPVDQEINKKRRLSRLLALFGDESRELTQRLRKGDVYVGPELKQTILARAALTEGAFRILACKASNPLNAQDTLQLLVHLWISNWRPFLTKPGSEVAVLSILPFFDRLRFLWASSRAISRPVLTILSGLILLLKKAKRESEGKHGRAASEPTRREPERQEATQQRDPLVCPKYRADVLEPPFYKCTPRLRPSAATKLFLRPSSPQLPPPLVQTKPPHRSATESQVPISSAQPAESAPRRQSSLEFADFPPPAPPPRKDPASDPPPSSSPSIDTDLLQSTVTASVFAAVKAVAEAMMTQQLPTPPENRKKSSSWDMTPTLPPPGKRGLDGGGDTEEDKGGGRNKEVDVGVRNIDLEERTPAPLTIAPPVFPPVILPIQPSLAASRMRNRNVPAALLTPDLPTFQSYPPPVQQPAHPGLFLSMPNVSAGTPDFGSAALLPPVFTPKPLYVKPPALPSPPPREIKPLLPTYLTLPALLRKTVEYKIHSPRTGLRNLGNSCFLNSILQALFICNNFLINLFRYQSSSHESDSSSEERNEDSDVDEKLLRNMQVLFAILLNSRRDYVSPKFLLKTLPDYYQSGQQDASEVLRHIFAALGGQSKALIKMVFAGQIVTKVQCSQCRTVKDRTEVICDLSFPVSSSRVGGIESLLGRYLEMEVLEGSNAYQCETCDVKVRASRWVEIQSPPAHLFVVLNRFAWDVNTGQQQKVTSFVRIERILIVQGLQYELFAVVMHQGSSANSGHYYTYGCRSEKHHHHHNGSNNGSRNSSLSPDRVSSSKWYKFNDTEITKVKVSEGLESILKKEAKNNNSHPYIVFYRCSLAPPSPPLVLVSKSVHREAKSRVSEDNWA